MFYRLGEFGYGLICVAVFDAVADAVVQMTFEDDLPDLVERLYRGVYLDQNILAGDILIHHFIDRVYLTDYFTEPPVQIIGVHTLFHILTFFSNKIIYYTNIRREVCQKQGGRSRSLGGRDTKRRRLEKPRSRPEKSLIFNKFILILNFSILNQVFQDCAFAVWGHIINTY